MAGGGAADEEIKLQGTPTWIVAVVCAVIICISLFFERFLHYLGKMFLRKNKKPLFQALQRMKEELMLMGFISLLLVVSQGAIQKICIPERYTQHMRPCRSQDLSAEDEVDATAHFISEPIAGILGHGRRLLSAHHCARQGKVPLLSIEAIHELHIFIFALAATQVALSVKTIVLAGVKIHKWKHWEESIHEEILENAATSPTITHVQKTEIIKNRFRVIRTDSVTLSWVHSFSKQFFSSMTKSDYRTMRLGFITTHCKGNLKFDFHKYMIRALEDDCKKVVGMSWYLWILVIVLLLLNIGGWHEYFWLSFVPMIMLLIVGTKLEHIITQLTHDVAEKHSTIEGEMVIMLSDDYFWFHRPRILLFIIHLILFLVAFEFAYFFWILATFGYSSCIMDTTKYVIPRLVVCFAVRAFCSYRTLPLYAIVTQMGSSYKAAIFEEHIKKGLIQWAQKAKMKRKKQSSTSSKSEVEEIQLQNAPTQKDLLIEEGGAEIVEAKGSQINHAS